MGIPWFCGGGSCSVYAADFSNAGYRQYVVNTLKSTLARGYRGVFISNVNIGNILVAKADGTVTAPIDRYISVFMVIYGNEFIVTLEKQ